VEAFRKINAIKHMIIKSLLDTDLYKMTQGQVVFFDFPNVWVHYSFTNRGGTQFPPGFADALNSELRELNHLRMSPRESRWMKLLPYFRSAYVEWFSGYQFNYNEVNVNQTGGDLSIDIDGFWYRTIHWEVVLMAMVSELYFKMTGQVMAPDSFKKIDIKASKLENAECFWSDFGTRRRFSFEVQNEVVARMKHYKGFLGTSNPYLAMIHGVSPIGTSAHEATMAMQAIYGVHNSNRKWLEHWYNFYRGELGIALTDTITTDVFLKDFDSLIARIYDGTRHDSGDPYIWGEKIINHYKKLGINPLTKNLVFSDGLDTDKFIDISKAFAPRVHRVVGGIGTHFTNDVGNNVKPLNIVIKLSTVSFDVSSPSIGVVKLSDTPGKHNGTPEDIANVKYQLYQLGIE
jgi:nicotinate phosphoribosyltransferase